MAYKNRTKSMYRVTALGSTADSTMLGLPRVSARVVAKCENHAKAMLIRDRSLTEGQIHSMLYSKIQVVHICPVTSDTFYSVVIDKEESTDA
jgi:hypothetical protein